jgi:hypothetical protein
MSHDEHHPTDTDDDALQEVLGSALRDADPVPRNVIAAARGAWTWRTIDQELADLVFDSATELTGVREHGGTRQLTFRAPGLEIEVMVADPTTRRLVGQLVPSRTATVRLEGAENALEQAVDRFGRFTFDSAPPGPVRLTVSGSDGAAVTTDWILL